MVQLGVSRALAGLGGSVSVGLLLGLALTAPAAWAGGKINEPMTQPGPAESGMLVELFTSDYLTVDPDHEPIRWTLDDPQRQTLWGHPAPKSWFEEGSPFKAVPVREPVLEARPMVAR